MVWHEALSDDTRLRAVPKTHSCIINFHVFANVSPLCFCSLQATVPPQLRDRLFSSRPSLLALLLRGAYSRATWCSKRSKNILSSARVVSFPLVPLPYLTTPCSSPGEGQSIACSPQHPSILLEEGSRKGVQPPQDFPSGRQEQSVMTDVFRLNTNPAPADLWLNCKNRQHQKDLVS